jgi:hypothetical protein
MHNTLKIFVYDEVKINKDPRTSWTETPVFFGWTETGYVAHTGTVWTPYLARLPDGFTLMPLSGCHF